MEAKSCPISHGCDGQVLPCVESQLWLGCKEKEEWLTRYSGKGRSGNYAKGIKGSFSGPSSGGTECKSLLRGNRAPTSSPKVPYGPGPNTPILGKASSLPSRSLSPNPQVSSLWTTPPIFQERSDFWFPPQQTSYQLAQSLLSCLGKGSRYRKRRGQVDPGRPFSSAEAGVRGESFILTTRFRLGIRPSARPRMTTLLSPLVRRQLSARVAALT